MWSEVSEEQLDQQIKQAKLNYMKDNSLRAKSAIFLNFIDVIQIEFANGCVFMIPTYLIEGLNKAYNIEDKNPTLVSDGRDLHWENLDIQIHIADLIVNMF